jgi:hypothetical protein
MCRVKPSEYEIDIKDTEKEVASSELNYPFSSLRINELGIDLIPEPDMMDGTFGLSLQALFNSDDYIDTAIFTQDDLHLVMRLGHLSQTLASIALTSAKGDSVQAMVDYTWRLNW